MDGHLLLTVLLALLLISGTPSLACWPDYIEKAGRDAQLVLTAKITQVGSTRGHGKNRTYKLVMVQIKDILKGEEVYLEHLKELLSDEEATLLEDPLDLSDEVSEDTDDVGGALTSSEVHNARGLMGVEGVRVSATCGGRVRTGDTQVFFLKAKSSVEVPRGTQSIVFEVTSQPLKVNLNILRLVEAVVEGKFYRVIVKLHRFSEVPAHGDIISQILAQIWGRSPISGNIVQNIHPDFCDNSRYLLENSRTPMIDELRVAPYKKAKEHKPATTTNKRRQIAPYGTVFYVPLGFDRLVR
ncbi:uncharacterized protein [Palaemon carinicauda]|uniref:uncharacterized protein n=1 Tax=Palaemon carinicauda TaxID=392227 RepID=UPI0035B613CF